jgi:cellobiose phosphorylase
MYRLIVESLLGLRLTGTAQSARLHFAPCLPVEWQSFKLHYRYRETVYHITIRQSAGPRAGMTVSLDGDLLSEPAIPLIDDRGEHQVEVLLQVKTSEVLAAVAG